MNFGLSIETTDRIKGVFQKYPEVESVIIYGSRAKGNFREGSDIDLTLKGKSIPTQSISDISSALDDLNTPYLFDISIFDRLNSPDLAEHISRIGKVFYAKAEIPQCARSGQEIPELLELQQREQEVGYDDWFDDRVS